MTDLKFVMLANIIIRLGYIICVTMAAMHFENAVILWWYLMVLIIGYEYKTPPKGD